MKDIIAKLTAIEGKKQLNEGSQWEEDTRGLDEPPAPIGEAGPSMLSKVYPDTKDGVLQYMQYGYDKSFLRKLDLPTCKIHSDPQVEGVWAVDSMASGFRCIIYLAGYNDPWGQKRENNDNEEGGFTMSYMKKLVEHDSLNPKLMKHWVKCGSLEQDDMAKLMEYYSQNYGIDEALLSGPTQKYNEPDEEYYDSDDYNYCPECGEEYASDATECPHCGAGADQDGKDASGWDDGIQYSNGGNMFGEANLNEYLVREGNTFDSILALNIFCDLYGEESIANYEEEFAESRLWKQVVRKYAPIAKKLEREIKMRKGQKLTQAEADVIEDSWYDGSDAYDDVNEAGSLIEIYDEQIRAVESVLRGEAGGGLGEATNHMGEKEYGSFNSWRRACRQANPAVKFEGDMDICNAKPGVGEWDGVAGVVYNATGGHDEYWDNRFKNDEEDLRTAGLIEGPDEENYRLFGYEHIAIGQGGGTCEGYLYNDQTDEEIYVHVVFDYEPAQRDRPNADLPNPGPGNDASVEMIQVTDETGREYPLYQIEYDTDELIEAISNESEGVGESQVNELKKATVRSYADKRLDQTMDLATSGSDKEYDKAERAVMTNIPRALSKLGNPKYGKQKPRLAKTEGVVTELSPETHQSYQTKSDVAISKAQRAGDKDTYAKRAMGFARSVHKAPPPDMQKRIRAASLNTEGKNMTRKNTIKEGVDFGNASPELIKILRHFGKEVADFQQGGELDDNLYDALYDYYFDDMPYGTKKARTGDPYEWIADRLDQDISGGKFGDVTDKYMADQHNTMDPYDMDDPAPGINVSMPKFGEGAAGDTMELESAEGDLSAIDDLENEYQAAHPDDFDDADDSLPYKTDAWYDAHPDRPMGASGKGGRRYHDHSMGEAGIAGSVDPEPQPGEEIVTELQANDESKIIDYLSNIGLDHGLDFWFEGDEIVVIGRKEAKLVTTTVGGHIQSVDGEEYRIGRNERAKKGAPTDIDDLVSVPRMFDDVNEGKMSELDIERKEKREKAAKEAREKKAKEAKDKKEKAELKEEVSADDVELLTMQYKSGQLNYDQFREKLDSLEHTDYSMRQGEMGMQGDDTPAGHRHFQADQDDYDEFGVDGEFVDGDEFEEGEFANSAEDPAQPEVHTSTTAMINQGDDLNRPKKQSWPMRNKGDNPMAEARGLMKQYNAMKAAISLK